MSFFAGSPIINGQVGPRHRLPSPVMRPAVLAASGTSGPQPHLGSVGGIMRPPVASTMQASLSHQLQASAPHQLQAPQQKKRRMEVPLGAQPKYDKATEPNQPKNQCCCRSFLKLPSNAHTFHTEEWKNRQTTVYKPLADDVMLNTANLEQISFSCGSFFVGDESGTYCGSRDGNVINLWRFDKNTKKAFVARSLLFTDQEAYDYIRKQLEDI